MAKDPFKLKNKDTFYQQMDEKTKFNQGFGFGKLLIVFIVLVLVILLVFAYLYLNK